MIEAPFAGDAGRWPKALSGWEEDALPSTGGKEGREGRGGVRRGVFGGGGSEKGVDEFVEE
jgi:hypothetical protein